MNSIESSFTQSADNGWTIRGTSSQCTVYEPNLLPLAIIWCITIMLDQVEGTVASLLLPSQDHQCYILRVMTPSDTLIHHPRAWANQVFAQTWFLSSKERQKDFSSICLYSPQSGHLWAEAHFHNSSSTTVWDFYSLNTLHLETIAGKKSETGESSNDEVDLVRKSSLNPSHS